MHSAITGIILAGGRATRMGGKDKGLVCFSDKPLYQHVLARLQPQVNTIVISANRHQQEYQLAGYPVIADSMANYPGPLAGMLTGLQHSATEWILVVPCDTPFLPMDLAQRLWQQKGDALIACAGDGERVHPTMVLMHRSVEPALSLYLQQGERKVMLFFSQQNAAVIHFPQDPQSFRNINTLEECQQWQPDSH
ncbi:MAG: molybdenum cofactor guanylyltransferase MobA [Enterobacteriaceae bacterium]